MKPNITVKVIRHGGHHVKSRYMLDGRHHCKHVVNFNSYEFLNCVFLSTVTGYVRIKRREISERNSELQVTTSRPRSGKWLIFLNSMLSLEEFFAKIYVPFDSEFLVAQSSSRSRDKSQEVTLT